MNKDIERIKGIVLSKGSTDPKGGKVLKLEIGSITIVSSAKERLKPMGLRVYDGEITVLFVSRTNHFSSYPLEALRMDAPKLFEKIISILS